jgi:4-amino-4-deoxy-L-arabinose transferase-like glycosyltransferase
MRTRHILGIILLVAAIFRLYALGSLPPGIANDEAGYIYSAYSIWKTGRDPTGTFLPLSVNLDNSFSPVYIYATAPFVGLLGVSPWSGRLPFALAGIMCVALLYIVAKKLSGNEEISLIASAILSVTPWHIHVSRAAFDANFALLFFLAAFAAFLHSIKKSLRWTVWTLVLLCLAFYSYHATKLYFVFLVPILLFVYWNSLTKLQKRIYITGFIFILFSFFLINKTYGTVSRNDVLIWNNPLSFAAEVNWERSKNTAPFALRPIFSNKALSIARHIVQTYGETLSTNVLFLYGETGALTSVYGGIINQGFFYMILFPALLFGLTGIPKLKKNEKILLVSLALIAPVPSALASDRTYIFRSFLLLIPLPIIMAMGIHAWLTSIRSIPRLSAIMCYAGVSILCIACITQYTYHYFFRYPVYGAERWFASSTDLSEYLKVKQHAYTDIRLVGAGSMYMFQYGVINHVEPDIIHTAWKNRDTNAHIENISLFDFSCLSGTISQKKASHSILLVLPDRCAKYTTVPEIDRITDRGEPLRTIWHMYEVDATEPIE